MLHQGWCRPLKPFRNLKRHPKPRLTTIFAIKCSDGLVMCSDTQATVGGQAKEIATKIKPTRENAILGCAGNDLYIQLLEDIFEESFSPDSNSYKDSITDCVRSYSKEVSKDMKAGGVVRRIDGLVPRLYETDALLAFSDSKFDLHLFEINAPYGAREQRVPPFRLSIGSGGFISDFILKTIEDRVFVVAKTAWEQLTILEVLQFSAFLLQSVGEYEANTSPYGRFYFLGTIDRIPREINGIEMFGENPNYLNVFFKTILGHHPEQVKNWVKRYVDDDLLANLLKLLSSPQT